MILCGIGVLWWGHKLIPGSCEAIKRLQSDGKTVYFVTNAPNSTRNELQHIAESRGYKITKDEILSVSYITAKYLHDLNFHKKAYLIGARGISEELKDLGIGYIDSDADEARDLVDIMANGLELDEEVGAIIVGFDTNFKYSKMLMASNYLKDPECMLIATSFDEVYPTSNGVIVPCIGPTARAIEVASGRIAINMGKPNPNMCKSLVDNGTIVPERTLVIGDTAKYDILLGMNCAFQTMLVGSGVNKMDDVRIWQASCNDEERKLIPDFYIPTLGDLLTLLKL